MQTKDSMDMSSKMEKLRDQAGKVSKILSEKLDELDVESLQALSSGTKNAKPMVAFRLNGAAEFINILLSKVEDFCQLTKEDESEIQPESADFHLGVNQISVEKKMQTKDSMGMLSSKMGKLKLQAEKLSTILSGKLSELDVECLQALSSGTKNAKPMVAFRLNGAAEFINILLSKVEEMVASLSELTERVKVLEKSALAVQTGGDDKKVDQSSTRIDKLESKLSCVEHAMEDLDSISATVGDCKKRVDNLQSNVCCMENAVENVDRGNRRMKEQLKKVSADQARLNKTVEEKEDRNKQVHHLLSKKVHQLETLQDILGELKLRADNKDNSMEDTVKATRSQVLELKDSYDTLSTQLTQVSGAHVGFTAILGDEHVLRNCRPIWKILTNRGNCYKAWEGHFVAPRDGLYGFFFEPTKGYHGVISLTLEIEGGPGTSMPVTDHYGLRDSVLYVVDLPSNTRVYIKRVNETGRDIRIANLLFVGWSIGYY